MTYDINEKQNKDVFILSLFFILADSKRSAHSNAYLYGFWNNKRIVLFDTLLADYTPVDRTEKEEESNADAANSDTDNNWEKVEV